MEAWIASQITGNNLFRNICILLMLLISLPALVLDRIARLFATHRRIRPRQLVSVSMSSCGVERTLAQEERDAVLSAYAEAKFVQKRAGVVESPSGPVIRLDTTPGERMLIFMAGSEVDITRFDKRGRPVATYWVRESRLRKRLTQDSALFQEDCP